MLGICGACTRAGPWCCAQPSGKGDALGTESTLAIGIVTPRQTLEALEMRGTRGRSIVTLARCMRVQGPWSFWTPWRAGPWPAAHNPSPCGVGRSPVPMNWNGLAVGSPVHRSLILVGCFLACALYPLLPAPTTRFYVNLLCGEGPGGEAALHFNPRLDESTVVFNSLEQGTWGREERGSGIPFQHGQPFDVLLIATEEGFKVSPCHPQARAPRPPPRLQSRQARKALGGGGEQRPGQGGAHVRSVPLLLPLAQPHVCPKAGVWPGQGPGGKDPAPRGWVAPSGKR